MKIKILFIASNPVDTEKLELESEAKAIEDRLNRADLGFLFEFASEFQVHLNALKQLLLHHRPQIVHFSGHGNPKGEIILENGRDGPVAVNPDALSDLFATLEDIQQTRCVVLNACFSASQADGIARSIPCVVGMTRAIEDDSAIAFAAGFYQAIGFGLSVKEAFDLGRNEIQFRPDAGTPRDLVATPVPAPPKGDNSEDDSTPDVDAPVLITRDGIDPRLFFIRPAPFESATKGTLPPAGARSTTRRAPRKKKSLHGKYSILGTLEEGPISRVDLAFDCHVDRHVAVKTLVEPAARPFFQQEVRELAKVAKHPNIVTIYGAWLDDEPPHYIREYIDGHSLQDELLREDRGDLPVDFALQVLTAIGGAIDFAQRMGVWNLGVKATRVLIQKMNVELNLGLTSHYNIVICPEIGDSEYVRKALPERHQITNLISFPPESFQGVGLYADDFDKANQYRLGILGYQMLLGAERFKNEVKQRLTFLQTGRQAAFPPWPRVKESERASCPSFLIDAIARMIDLNPMHRFRSLENAVAAITHRKLDIEVARDSFRRIVQDPATESEFFRAFYSRFLNASEEIKTIFAGHNLPHPDPPGQSATDVSPDRWPDLFRLLKEAIVLLFAYNSLREPQEPTILTRFAQSHAGYKPEYYDAFRDALIETVAEFDKGNYQNELKNAWERAIEPGLSYMANFPRNLPRR